LNWEHREQRREVVGAEVEHMNLKNKLLMFSCNS